MNLWFRIGWAVTLRREIFLLADDLISRLRVTGVWGHSHRSKSEQPSQDDNEPMVPTWLGCEIWNNKELGNHLASSVFLDGHLYGFTGRVNKKEGHLGCLDVATGKQLWTATIRGSLILAGDRLLILTLTGELIVATATPTAYKELARTQVIGGTSWTTPVLSDGRVYVRNSKGLVICLDVAKK